MNKLLHLTVFLLILSVLGCTSTSTAQDGPDMFSSADELNNAIRDASDYLNSNIPGGSKIVILNIQSASQNLSSYIIDELTANAVNDKLFTVVDRQQLETIRAEQQFQFSGEVDDTDALAIGKFFGAQTIVSGTVNRLGTGFRIGIRALEVETAQVQGQYNRNIASSSILNSLMTGGTSTAGTPPAASEADAQLQMLRMAAGEIPPSAEYLERFGGGAATGPVIPPAPATPVVEEPPITGTMVPGASLAAKLAWLTRSADSHGVYIVEVSADENIAPTRLFYQGAINITVVLRGDSQNRTIRLASNGYMFEVGNEVTLVLDGNITLMGHPRNNDSMIRLSGGNLKMRTGSVITGNTGGGVGNYKGHIGTFEMTGGSIHGNSASYGGGVSLGSVTFTMFGGDISGNTAFNKGGGVYINSNAKFNMKDGTITGNTAHENGGGVSTGFEPNSRDFTKSGGTITGYNSDQTNGNAVKDADGNILARRGHAVFIDRGTFGDTSKRKETTAGPEVTLANGSDGGWDR